MSDIRYAVRGLARSPGFAVTAIVTLGLGIGAAAAIFSVVNGVLLRPLGFREPERLVAIEESVPLLERIAPRLPVSAHHFREWRKYSRSFENLGMIGGATFNLTTGGEPERVAGARASASVFPMLGISAQIGRTFLEAEDAPGRDRVAVIGDGLWTRRFHRDPGVIGRKILLDGAPYEVIGVLPPKPVTPRMAQLVRLPLSGEAAEIWKPFAVRESELSPMGDFNYGCIARLKAGVTVAQAGAELNAIENGIARTLDEKTELRVALTPLREQMTGTSRSSLLLLLAAVGAVLAIVCVNVAGLMLIRAAGRQRDLAIRAAMGAGAARLLRPMLAEAFAIAAAGGLLGIALAFAFTGVVARNAPPGLPRIDEIRVDGYVLAFSVLLTLAAAALFGLLPAVRSLGVDPQDALRSSGRALTDTRGGGRLRSLLVSVETGLSMTTLIAAGLLLGSFARLMRVEKGFEPEHVLTASLRLPELRYGDSAKRSQLLAGLLEQIRATPGVTAAGLSNMLPLAGEGSNNNMIPEGTPEGAAELNIGDFRCVSPGYAQAMGIPVFSGRMFEERDRPRRVAVMSARLAQRLWPDVNAIGKRFHLGSTRNAALEVIGVAGDVRGVSLQKTPNPTVYIPYWVRDRLDMALAVRTAGSAAGVAGAVRSAIRKMDPELPAPEFRTMEQVVNASVEARRFQLQLVGLFGAAALLLAAFGVYGVVSYAAAQRTNEVGIRMALGARGADVTRLLVRQGLTPAAAGVAAGVAGGLALARLLRGLLFGVDAADPATFLAAACVVLAATAVGCYFPARRAARVDPAAALRGE